MKKAFGSNVAYRNHWSSWGDLHQCHDPRTPCYLRLIVRSSPLSIRPVEDYGSAVRQRSEGMGGEKKTEYDRWMMKQDLWVGLNIDYREAMGLEVHGTSLPTLEPDRHLCAKWYHRHRIQVLDKDEMLVKDSKEFGRLSGILSVGDYTSVEL